MRNGHRLVDPSGLDCRDDSDAVAKAEVIAEQIATDVPKPSSRKVAVLNSSRHEVDHVDIKAKNGPGAD